MDGFEFAAILIAIAVIALAVLMVLRVGRANTRRSRDDGAPMTAGTVSLAVSSDAGSCSDGGGGCD